MIEDNYALVLVSYLGQIPTQFSWILDWLKSGWHIAPLNSRVLLANTVTLFRLNLLLPRVRTVGVRGDLEKRRLAQLGRASDYSGEPDGLVFVVAILRVLRGIYEL